MVLGWSHAVVDLQCSMGPTAISAKQAGQQPLVPCKLTRAFVVDNNFVDDNTYCEVIIIRGKFLSTFQRGGSSGYCLHGLNS